LVALRTVSLLVLEAGGEGAWFQQDVLLDMLVPCGQGLQIRVLTPGADPRGRHLDHLIDVGGLGALPGRVTYRGAALPGWRQGFLRFWGGGFAPFELAAVQGLKLRLELLVFPFDLLAPTPLLLQLLVQLCQLIFVVGFSAGDLLITFPDPAGGEALQIRAPVPMGTAETGGQVFELGHG
jgi:hypothetical protein